MEESERHRAVAHIEEGRTITNAAFFFSDILP